MPARRARWLLAPFHWLGVVLRALFGSLRWQPPGWIRSMGAALLALSTWFRARPAMAAAGALAIAGIAVGGVAGYRWYQAQPRPVEVTFKVTPPPRTEIENREARPAPVTIEFSAPVARIELVDKEVGDGIVISPAVAGRWRFNGDRELTFEPKNDWPVGTDFSVAFDHEKLFIPTARLAQRSARFQTAAFTAQVTDAQFHQDPTDPAAKKVVATVTFSHPVDGAEFEKRLALRLEGQSAGVLGFGGEKVPVKVSYDKLRLNAYVLTDRLSIPPRDQRLDITLESGVKSSRGGNGTAEKIVKPVTVPGLYSLKITRAQLALVTNDRHEPEQVVVLATSASVNEREIANNVSAWLLPVHHPNTAPEDRKAPHSWGNPSQVGPEVLKEAEPLKLEPIASEREHTDLHSFRYQAAPGRYVYLKANKGVRSFGGYVLGEVHERILRVPAYPKELKFMSTGSLLAMTGERKLPVVARDVEGVRFSIGRLLPHQIQHLVTQSQGNFSSPEFLDSFDETYVTERFEDVIALPKREAGKAQYASIDLGRYLEQDPANRRGIFLLTAEGWDPQRKRPAGVRDRRLVVVTDLGVVVKRNVDGTHDTFVQSIATGDPVAGASVELLGRNGLAAASQNTDAQGRAALPSTRGLTAERTPALFVVRKGGDVSFLPVGRADRELDYSRFDVGGVAESADSARLSAYLFSDRGIYRPGEEIRLGAIVKSRDWSRKLAGVPLEIEIADPRGLAVKRDKVRLSAAGFEEIRHTTQDSSPTGTYSVAVYLVRDGERGSQLGATTVRVQDFLPDRMKMTARLSVESPDGWVSPADLKGRVSLQNLFGTPAENRRVAASVRLTPALTTFQGYRDFTFHDPKKPKEGVEETLTTATTNDRGEAEFDLGLQRFADATYRLSFVAEGYEADGGRSVSAETAQLVSSLPHLLGYRADGDLNYISRASTRNIELIAIDPQAKKTAVDGLTLVQIERKFVSVLTRQPNGTFKYESKRKDSVVSEKPFAIPADGVKLPVDTAAPGNFALAVRNATGLELARIDYAVAGQANVTRSLERNAELQLVLNKTDFARGDEIEVAIQAPYLGSGLITIERDRVYAHAWFKATTTSSVQKIRLPKDFEGNGYVNVAFVRDQNSDEIYMSPLSSGVVPFSVSLDSRRATVTLSAPELIKPGETLRMRAHADRPAKIVVFAVDEGILQVANYRTADPLGFFFQKRALGVRTAQILDLILPEMKRVMAGVAPGGDGEDAIGKNLNPFKRKRDKAVAYWSGVVDVGREDREFTWTVPDSFNGSLRVMAVAVADEAIGVALRKTTVRADLVISPNAPTTAAPGDEFEVSVGVSNNVIGSGKDARIVLQVAPTPHLSVVGAAQAELRVGELREGVANFRFRATDTLGSATLAFTASLNGRSNRIATDVSVRPAMPFMTELQVGTVKGKATAQVSRDLHADFRKLEASISHVPLSLAHGLTSYLSDYPHLCTEQLVSQALPALVLADRPDFGYLRDSKGRVSAQERFAALIATLRQRQNAEGGFGLYTASSQIEPVPSLHAVLFLIEARDRRQPVPVDVLRAASGWLQEFAASEGEKLADERERAEAAYLLTRQGVVTTNIVAAIQKRLDEKHAKTWKGDAIAAWMGATYQMLKQDRLARAAVADLAVGTAKEYALYHDPHTRDAQIVWLFARHMPERYKALGPEALQALVRPIERGQYNTLSSAFTLLALDAVATLGGDQAAGAKFALTEILADGKTRPLALPGSIVPRVAFGADARQLQFGNENDLVAYYVVNQSGFDRALPTKEIRNGIELSRDYLDAGGKPVKSARLGEEIEVHLRIRTIERKFLDNVAVVDLLPGGFEVVFEPRAKAEARNEGARGSQAEDRDNEPAQGNEPAADADKWKPPIGTAKSTWELDYADVREDRVVLYGDATDEVKTFIYRIKATNAGTYTVPPSFAEGMYDRSAQARTLGGRITVDKAGAAKSAEKSTKK